jgi:hypothetical protein
MGRAAFAKTAGPCGPDSVNALGYFAGPAAKQ